MNCSLCRAGREGINTLHRAQSRSTHWPQTQTSIRSIPRLEVGACIINELYTFFLHMQDPEIFTNLDDAFSSIFQFLQISTRKCGVSDISSLFGYLFLVLLSLLSLALSLSLSLSLSLTSFPLILHCRDIIIATNQIHQIILITIYDITHQTFNPLLLLIQCVGWMDGWMDGWMGGWMCGWMDGWMNGGWMDGWVGG